MCFKEHRKTLYIILGQILLSNRGCIKICYFSSTSKERYSFSGILSHICGSPGSPEGGRVILPGPRDDGVTKVYDIGTEARYDCDKDRVLFGPRIRECLQNGRWSDSIPICSRLCWFIFTLLKFYFPELSLSYNRSTLHSDTNSIFGSQLAVDGGGELERIGIQWDGNLVSWTNIFLQISALAQFQMAMWGGGKFK